MAPLLVTFVFLAGHGISIISMMFVIGGQGPSPRKALLGCIPTIAYGVVVAVVHSAASGKPFDGVATLFFVSIWLAAGWGTARYDLARKA